MGSIGISSASGLLSLLEDDQDEVRTFALEKLNSIVDGFWSEIADSLQKIEILSENDSFKSKKLASLVVSKVYYHLEQYQEALNFALSAGELFDVSKSTEYVDVLVAKCIDEYIRLRQLQATEPQTTIDSRLERIVEGMFDRCYHDKKFKQALGIAIETRRLDKIEYSVMHSDNVPEMLLYCQKVSMELVLNKGFRTKILELLVKLHNQQKQLDYLPLIDLLVHLNDSTNVAAILNQLIGTGSADNELTACQICFDLVNNSTQQFIGQVLDKLPPSSQDTKLENLRKILGKEITIAKYLDFLCSNNKTDPLILKNIKTATEGRSSMLHLATMYAHSFMNAGTTNDTFLRDNLEWLSRATNWAKFSAIGGLGVIHKGQHANAKTILGPYLPTPGGASPYSEGGSLYAIGLIHANHGAPIVNFLLEQLDANGNNEIVQHGACLGLGVAAMATGNEVIYEKLKNVLFADSAVAGEAAGLAIGLVMLGSASQVAIDELLPYAHDTQHEKVIRGLAIGLALIMYGKEEGADTLIEQLLLDKDPILRYGAMYTIGLAYCGTANNDAIKRLLHVAVSDVSDDVRRAAVTCLGFVLFRQPERVPEVVSLLAESYNAHVRYGAALALGIACAGTGSKDALAILEPLAADTVDFVRQGALIALAMVLMQQSKAQEPKVEQIRKLFEEKIGDRHEEINCKFGAILASGIIDAGGRNVTVSPLSKSGHNNMTAIVGLAVFTQFWYWYPLVLFLNLSFTPTALIGLNKDLKTPVFKFKSNAKPSSFAYPPNIVPPVTTAPQKVSKAVLSVTKKTEARDQKKAEEKDKKKDSMEVDKPKEEEKKEDKKEEKKEEKEPDFEVKSNPSRVTLSQGKYLSFDVDERYTPIRTKDIFGIVMLKDNKPGQPEEFVAPGTKSSSNNNASDEGEEPQAPEPFEFDPDK